MNTISVQDQKISLLQYIPNKFIIQEYDYSLLKITPFKSGYSAKDFEKLVNTLSKYSTSFLQRFELKERELIYHPPQPLCYEVLFSQNKILYTFAIPEIYKQLFMNKTKFILSNCDINEIPDYLNEFIGSIKQTYKYGSDWFMSLDTSDSVNLNDGLIVLTKDLQKNDRVLLQYMFQPITDINWKGQWQTRYNSYSKHGNLRNTTDLVGKLDCVANYILNQADSFLDGIMAAFYGEKSLGGVTEKINYAKDLSESTKKKSIYDGFKTNINVYYKTQEPITADNVSRNIATIFKDVDNDNNLKPNKTKLIKDEKQLQRVSRKGMTTNTKEVIQFIKTPSEKIMKEFEDILDKVNVADMEMPKELLNGQGIKLGDLQKGSKYIPITYGKHASSNSKPIVYISPQEGGKSSNLRYYGVGAVCQGDSIFAFDTIDGQTVKIIRDYLPPQIPDEKIIILDFRSNEYAFPLAWNELFDDFQQQLDSVEDEFKRYQIMENFSGIMGSELIRFVDTFQAEDKQNKLTPAMRKLLVDIAQLVFMSGGSFGMIKQCLYDTGLRKELLNQLNLPKHLPFCQSILRLDNTKDSSTISGIETRLSLIMENATLTKYFSLNTDKKIDFAYWANNGYCVLIQIPEHFADSIITFLVQKLWLAVTSSRYNMPEEDRPHTHLLIDEPNRFPTIMNLLNDHLIASRKWHLRFLFFVHNIDIFRGARENLKNAGTTFIMLPTSYTNFSMVAEFYNPMDFGAMKEVEKLISRSNGKRRFALVSLHYKNVWYPCVVRLPLPIDMTNKLIDRRHINQQCAERYGFSQKEYYQSLFKQYEQEEIQIEQSHIAL